jgi:hypothetical protein
MRSLSRTTGLIATALVATALAAGPATAKPRAPHGKARPPVARAHYPGRHGGVRAYAAATTDSWRDATLDCYGNSGGIMGGSTYNNSVHLSILWKSPNNTTMWAGHRLIYEVYQDGKGPYWERADGTYGSSGSSPFYGPYRITQNGVIEWSKPYYNFDGSTATMYNPWSDEATFPKSVRTQVRAWIGVQTYDSTTGWSGLTWRVATPLHQASGLQPGFCSL